MSQALSHCIDTGYAIPRGGQGVSGWYEEFSQRWPKWSFLVLQGTRGEKTMDNKDVYTISLFRSTKPLACKQCLLQQQERPDPIILKEKTLYFLSRGDPGLVFWAGPGLV